MASFCRMRPVHISLVNFPKSNACLCTRNQNFALKLRTLKSVGVKNSVYPKTVPNVFPGSHESFL